MAEPPRFPVSVKGVVFLDRRVVLLENERSEWELPGGRLERGEGPEDCLRREIREELSIGVEIERLLDCWRYEVLPGVDVLIVTYGCRTADVDVVRSDEHQAVGLFEVGEIEALDMPEGYRRSIREWRRLTA